MMEMVDVEFCVDVGKTVSTIYHPPEEYMPHTTAVS